MGLVMGLAISLLTGCETTDHPTIEKWGRTQKGPEKLQKAFTDEAIDADLSAHAAAVMLQKGREADVAAGFGAMSQGRKAAVAKALAPRLWEIARVEKDTDRPTGEQYAGKDQLFALRKSADPDTIKTIDGYLTDWYAVPSYEARANGGGVIGPKVLRTIGPSAGKKMISAANSIIASPKNKIKPELLLGLAATGSPDAVKYVLDVAKMERNDPELANNAMDALFRAYIKNDSLFDVIPSEEALGPNLDQLAAVVKDEKMPGHAANNAVDLIRSLGAPRCVKPLVEMIGYPHKEPDFIYVAVQNALVCGGVKSIQEIIRALPEGSYDHEAFVDSIVKPMTKLTPRPAVVAATKELLDDPKLVVKWVAIEAVGELKSVDEAPRLAAIAKDGRKLLGYWGDQSDKPAADRKADPTLGGRAKEISDKLAQKP
ncbi:MAG: hypothetical protein NT062_00080 [Proteobacteria bacterium]|nr:hypothetical protein [Pseudomonadota bacterium]